MSVRFVGLTAGLVMLAACQQPIDEELSDQELPALLPERPTGANTILTGSISVADGLEAIVQDALFAPNAELPAHYHPGEEVLYMIEGTVELMSNGKDSLTLRAGDAHVIPAGLVHRATAGPLGARAVIFRAHPKGEEVRILAEEDGEDE